VGQQFLFMRCNVSAVYIPRDPLGEHFIFNRSNGRHFMFRRSSVSALRVHEMHWVSSLCSKRSIGSALRVQEVKCSSLHVPEIQWVNTSCWRGQMVVTSCSRNPVGQHFMFTRSSGPALYIQDIQWSAIHILEVQWVSTSDSRCKMIRQSSSGQHFLFKKSSVQHFVFKGLCGYNFRFKRPYDQRFVLKRSSVQHVLFKRSSDRHWNGISAVRPVICVVCLRAAMEIPRFHAHSSIMDLASSIFRTNFTARHKKFSKRKYSKNLLRFLTFLLHSFGRHFY